MSSDIRKITIKLGPLVVRNDGDEYLPMQITVDGGSSVVWIEQDLKKCKDNTFFYEFAYRAGQGKEEEGGDTSGQITNKRTSSLARVVKKEYDNLNLGKKAIADEAPTTPKSSNESPTAVTAAMKKVKITEPVDRSLMPKIQKFLRHNDAISALAVDDEWMITGCRGGTLHVWTINGKHRLLIPAHKSSVEAVAWIHKNKDVARFVSVSKDETTMIWDWNIDDHSVSSIQCTHQRLGTYGWFDTVSVNQDKTTMVCGGWDSMLKFWSTEPGEKTKPTIEALPARNHRGVMQLMKGHTGVITGVVWSDKNEIISCSLDETVKVWDYEQSKIKQEFSDKESFYKLDYSPLNRCIIASTYDQVRLYDLRAADGKLEKTLFAQRKEPMRCLKWSTVDEHKFILAGGKMQVWDTRNPKSPLYDLRGHDEEVLCCDWSNPKFMVFGGEDSIVRIFESPRVTKDDE
nr:ribosome biogenesis protein WDR12 homolog [Megalopta genalis]